VNKHSGDVYAGVRQAWLDALGADGCKYPLTAEDLHNTIKEGIIEGTSRFFDSHAREIMDLIKTETKTWGES